MSKNFEGVEDEVFYGTDHSYNIDLSDIEFRELFVNEDMKEKDLNNWMISNNEHYPEANIEVTKELPAGMYSIGFNRNNGKYYLLRRKINCDRVIVTNKNLKNLIDSISSFPSKKDLYEKNKLIHKRSYLLHGPAGTGKTSHINMIVSEVIEKSNAIVISASQNCSITSLSDMVESIRKIEKDRLVLIIFEDVDEFFYDDESELTNFLDGSTQSSNIIFVMTTNKIENFPPRMLRPSRIDEVYEILCPEKDDIKQYLLDKGLSEEDSEKMSKLSFDNNFNMSEVKELFIGTQIQELPLDIVIERIKDSSSYITNKNHKKSKKNNNKKIEI